MARIRKIVMICAAMAALASCGDSDRNKAEEMLKQAGYDYEHGRYDMALATIDSLRKTYHDIVDVRREALVLYQNISLKKAQEDLEETDRQLQEFNATYEMVRETVEKKKAALQATAEELQTLTLMRIKRDSLQARFDMQCAKIKYIHKRQKEN